MRKVLLLLLLGITSWGLGNAQVISSFPQTENFELEATGPTGCGPSYAATQTWRNAAQWGYTATLNWTCDVGGTGSSNTGPSVDHTLGTNAGKYFYVESSCSGTGYPSITSNLVSTFYDFTALSAPQMEFWYHMYGTSMGTMHVDVDTGKGTGQWVLDIIPSFTDNQDLWQVKNVSLLNYAGMDSIRIRIRGITGTSFGSDMAVDDITVFEPQPYDNEIISVDAGSGCAVGTDTINSTITNVGTDTIPAGDTIYFCYQIDTGTVVNEPWVLTMPFAPGDTLMYSFSALGNFPNPASYTLTGIVKYSLDSSFGNDTTTATVLRAGFYTVTNFFQEDFESGTNGWASGGATSTWAFGTPAKTVIQGAASGDNAWTTGGLTGDYVPNEDSYVESPCFDISGLCAPWIAMNVWWNSEFSWDGMNIFGSTDGGLTWTQVGNFGDPHSWYNDNSINGNPGGSGEGWCGRNSTGNGSGGWVRVDHDLSQFAGANEIKFRIHFGSDGSVQDDGTAFDDFTIYNAVWLGDDQLVCAPDTATLDAKGNPGYSFLWSTGDTTSTIQVSTSGWYSVTVDADTNCTGVDSFYVAIQDTVQPLFTGPITSCGDSILICPEYFPSTTYFWSTADTTSSTGFGGATECNWVSGSQNVSVVMSNQCGIVIDSVDLVLLGSPMVNAGPDTSYCDMGTLMATGGSTVVGYLWSTGDTTMNTMVTTSGTYMVTAIDSNGCPGMDSVAVMVNASPSFNLGVDTLLCDGDTACIGTMMMPGAMYTWSTGATTAMTCVTTAGSYSLMVTDSNGCMGNDTIAVTTGQTPAASFSFTQQAGAGLGFDFTDASTGGTSWAWDFGDGNTSTSQNPSHTYANAGPFTVTLTVTNACGSNTFTQNLIVTSIGAEMLEGMVAVYPNPNTGNFTVEINGLDVATANLEVLNLHGQVVFAANLSDVRGQFVQKVNLSDIASGIYMVRIQSDKGVAVKRITIK